MREVTLLRQCPTHPNVLRMLDFVEGDESFYLISELCKGPDLQVVLNKRGALTLDEARAFITQSISALVHLHENHILHRDIKPANLVVLEALPDLRKSPLTGCSLKLVD